MVIDIDDKITAKKLSYNQDNITDYELKSRDSRIGEITNIATSILNRYTEDDNIKKTYEDDVSLLRLYQGKEIDSIKTGVRWNITKKLRNNLKKLPYFLLYNYQDKLKKYHTVKKLNKGLSDEEKIPKNAFSSPSQMNELCDYINRWEKKKLLWNKSYENTGILLIDNSVQLDNQYLLCQFRKLNNDFLKEWKKTIAEKDKNPAIDLHKCLNKYRSLVLGFSDDKKMIANYFIKTCYKSIDTNKILCWYIFGDEMIENLIKNSPQFYPSRYVEIANKDEAKYEYLGKYYKEEEYNYEL